MREFKPGDKVITFEWNQKNKWSPKQLITTEVEVLAVRDGKVVVDSMFGEVEFDPEDVEWADLPF